MRRLWWGCGVFRGLQLLRTFSSSLVSLKKKKKPFLSNLSHSHSILFIADSVFICPVWSSNFFCIIPADGVNIKNGRDGVHLTLSREGRPSGEAYVEVASEDDVALAEKKHNQHMGRRYIEGN